MGTKEFENNRWASFNSTSGFRQIMAASLIEPGNRVLDLGCGDGILYEVLGRPAGMVGLDISEEAVKKAKAKGLDARVFDFANAPLPFTNGEFDSVVLLDVLEHFYDPLVVIKEAARAGKELIIGVPNFNSLPARIQVLSGRVPENNTPHKGHVFWFSWDGLKMMLAKEGYGIEDAKFNTFWENTLGLGDVTKYAAKKWPSLFALSFVVKAIK